MPESKKRKKDGKPVTRSTSSSSSAERSSSSKAKKKGPSPRWFAPMMLGFFLIGIGYLVLFYVTSSTDDGMPFLSGLGNAHLLVGFSFILVGFVLSTQWR